METIAGSLSCPHSKHTILRPPYIFHLLMLIYAVSYMKSYEVYVENDDLVFHEGATIKVRWSPVSIFPMELPDAYNVDIDLLQMNLVTGTWDTLTSLASDIPNNGIADVTMPSVEPTDTVEESVSPVVVRVSLNVTQASRKEILYQVCSADLVVLH